jgi:hypothetical protein
MPILQAVAKASEFGTVLGTISIAKLGFDVKGSSSFYLISSMRFQNGI